MKYFYNLTHRISGETEHHAGALPRPVNHQVEVAVVEVEHARQVHICLRISPGLSLDSLSSLSILSVNEKSLLSLIQGITVQRITQLEGGKNQRRPQYCL